MQLLLGDLRPIPVGGDRISKKIRKLSLATEYTSLSSNLRPTRLFVVPFLCSLGKSRHKWFQEVHDPLDRKKAIILFRNSLFAGSARHVKLVEIEEPIKY